MTDATPPPPTPKPARPRRPRRDAHFPRGMTRRTLVQLSVLTTLAMTLLALIVLVVMGASFRETLLGGFAPGMQLLVGSAIGAAAGVLGGVLGFRLPGTEQMQEIVRSVFRQFRPRTRDLALVSAGAGWGEELLFRGAIQPLVGIWPAAILFALAHGLLTRLTLGRVAYTLALVAAGAGLGYLAEWAGLLAAITAHAVYDFVALLTARRALGDV